MFDKKLIEKRKVTEDPDEETRRSMAASRELCSKIAVLIPHRPGEGIHAKLVEYIIQWVNAGIAYIPYEDCFGSHIDLLRANMCYDFLRQTDRRYLILLDNDIIPDDPEAILRLCSHAKPVVSGIACAARPGKGIFACVAVEDQTGVARFPTTADTKYIPAHGLCKIKCAGAGFLAIRRDVLESMREEPFLLSHELRVEAARTGVLRKSEDIYFSEQVYAAGYDMFVDFSVHCFHAKHIPLHWPQDLIDPNLDPETWNVTEQGLAVELK